MNDPDGLTRTLGEVEVCRDHNGRMQYFVGNSSVVFRIMHSGRCKMLKCYTRPKHNLEIIYKENLLRNELYCGDGTGGEWADVVIYDYVDGRTLDEEISYAAKHNNTERFSALASKFDRFASQLLTEEWAHGDLKPENIIIGGDGELHLIDFDAMFLPCLEGQPSSEIGTAAYQHPQRTPTDFDRHLDDYPIALISTALHALAEAPHLYDKYSNTDGLLISPTRLAAGTDGAFSECLELFARKGLALRYRIAKLLYSTTYRLRGLDELLGSTHKTGHADDGTSPELYEEGGLWGYHAAGRKVIPPLFDIGFDFTEGLAAVCVAGYWHFIDRSGAVVINCSHYDAVKPFRNGTAEVRINGRSLRIDKAGRVPTF